MSFTTWKERSNKKITMITKEFQCNINPSIILGRRGETIKNIQTDTSTHITLIRETGNIIITAYLEDNIQKAWNLIQNLSNNSYKNNSYKNNSYDNNLDFSDNNLDENNLDFSDNNFPTLGSTKIQNKPTINTCWGN